MKSTKSNRFIGFSEATLIWNKSVRRLSNFEYELHLIFLLLKLRNDKFVKT